MIGSEEELRAKFGEVHPLATAKTRPALDKYSRQFIAMSPFVVVSTADASGKALVAELGDEHGSSLCQLLDHLTHGAGPATTMAVFLADCPAQSPDGRARAREHLTTRRSFDARGPPPLT